MTTTIHNVLCIPRIECTITKEYIQKIINRLNIGKIESFQEIPHNNDSMYKRIIIKIKWNMQTSQSQTIHNRLMENKSIKIVHDMPWYWLCVKYVKHKQLKSGIDPELAKMMD